jgi:hypothetical protein
MKSKTKNTIWQQAKKHIYNQNVIIALCLDEGIWRLDSDKGTDEMQEYINKNCTVKKSIYKMSDAELLQTKKEIEVLVEKANMQYAIKQTKALLKELKLKVIK